MLVTVRAQKPARGPLSDKSVTGKAESITEHDRKGCLRPY
jgi:hypothetical protein